ncbi:MAG: RluA family pseudouridine synthase [Vicinamibacterales bacterium]
MSEPVTFLYSDDTLVVVDKPAGVTVIPAPDVAPGACLRDRVASAVGGSVWVVHRLDRDTSGAVVFARTADAHRTLSMAFEHRDVAKTYRALTAGAPTPAAGTIDVALHEARKGKARPATPGEPGARAASTRYETRRTWHLDGRAVADVTAWPATGRHHQIRVHLRAIGTPILGDTTYGGALVTPFTTVPVPRLALHAAALDVPHPVSGRRVVVEAPWPADLAAVTAWLEAHAAAGATS